MANPVDFRGLVGGADDAALALTRIVNRPTGTGASKKHPHHHGKQQDDDLPPAASGQSLTAEPHWLSVADNVANKATMAAFLGPAAIGGVAWGLGKAGKAMGSAGLEKAGAAVAKPLDASFATMGAKLGPIGALGRGITNMSMQGMALVTDAMHAVGLTDLNARRWGNKLDGRLDKLHTHAGEVFSTQVAHPELQKAMQGLQGAYAAHPEQLGSQSFRQALGQATELAVKHDAKMATKLTKMGTLVEHATDAHHMMDGWANLSEYTRAAPQKMANVKVTHGALNAGILVGSGISAYRTTRDLGRSLKNLREMYADVTGQKVEDVSTTKLMFGKVPDVVGAARKQLYKEFGPSAVLEAMNLSFNVSWVIRNKGSMLLLMAAGMGSQLYRSAFTGTLLPAYMTMKESQAHGERLPPEAYAAVLGDACDELHKRGGANSNFTQVLAKHYADENANVRQVLQEIGNGKVHHRIAELQKEYEAQHGNQLVPQQECQHDMIHKMQDAGQGALSYVDRLRHPQAAAKQAAPRPVVGENTEKLHMATAQAAIVGAGIG